MRKRLKARVGDKISYKVLGGTRTGVVVAKHSDYLIIALEEPRPLADWEHMVPAYSDPTRDSLYVNSDYIIEEYGNG